MHFIFVSDKFGTVVNFNLIYIHRIISFFILLLFCPCHYFLFSFYFQHFFILFLFCKLVTYIGRRYFSHNIFLTIFLDIFFHSFWVVDYFCLLCFDLIFAQLLFDFFFTFLVFLVFYIITCVYERYILFTFK